MAVIIDGKKLSEQILDKCKHEIISQKLKPGLAVVIVGEDPASKVYVRRKIESCKRIGVASFRHELPDNTTEKDLLELINTLNNDKNVNGILVQLPLPKHISQNKVVEAISPEKDVDGFHPINFGRLVINTQCFKPCTPLGIMMLLDHYSIKIQGIEAVVIGRSMIVGTPIALMLLNSGATVTVCHSKTKDLACHVRNADLIVSAAGKCNLVTDDMVKEGAIVIDVGMNKKNGKLCGDVDFAGVKNKSSHITPVPGGVGPMTIACLMQNTLQACKSQHHRQ